MAVKVIFLSTTGAGTWTVPADWTSTNKVECIGGGGGGYVAVAGGGGGGGGAYSSVSNIATLSPAQVVDIAVGAGGTSSTAGGDTWFGATTLASSLVGAKGGAGSTAALAAPGGQASGGFPASGGVRNSGGAGGNGSAAILTGGGGGGAAGPGGAGGLAGNGDATATGADFGGGGGSGAGLTTAGGAGGAGTTTAGAGGTNATGGGSGGNGGAGNGLGASFSASPIWTATHQADGTTPSSSTASPGGGGGGGGSATNGFAGTGGIFGGGGGGRGVGSGPPDSIGAQGIIVITYTTSAPVAVNASATQTTALPTQSATGTVPGGVVNASATQTTARPTQTATGTVPSSGGGWTPLNLAGTKALYTAKDAASVTKDGSNIVSAWADQTSNHYDLLKPAAAGGPLYDAAAFGAGEPGIVFDGVDDMLSAAGIATNTDKIWVFARFSFDTAPANNDRIVSLTVPGGFRDFGSDSTAFMLYFGAGSSFDQIYSLRDSAVMGSSGNDPDTVIIGTPGTYGIIYDGTNSVGYLRDVAKTSVASTGIFGPISILNLSSNRPDIVNAGTDMRMRALAFGVGDLSQADITNIVGWLDNPVMGAVGPTAINFTGAQTTALPVQTATAAARASASATQSTALPTQAATAKALVSVIASGAEVAATVRIDFLTTTASVAGAPVGIETLLGADPNFAGTGYYPDAITQYGYDWYGAGKGNPPAALGALRTAIFRGDSCIIKLQTGSGGASSFQEYVEFYFYPIGQAYYFQLYNTGPNTGPRGDLLFDISDDGVRLLDVWTPQTGPNQVNVLGFNIISANHLDLAANDRDAGSIPLDATDTPPGNPLAIANLLHYGPLVSITTYPTLSLAALKAKTAPVLGQTPIQATDLPVQTATASIVTPGLNAGADQATALPVQVAAAAARVTASSSQSTALPTQTAAAGARVSASATQATPLPTQVATAAARASASATQTTTAPAQTAVASIVTPGLNHAADQTTPLPTQVATAAARVVALAVQTTGFATQVAAGAARVTASAAQISALPVQVATGTVRAAAQAAQSTAFPTQVATGVFRVTGTVTQATALPTQLALASLPLAGVNGSALQTTARPTQTATGRAIVLATSAQVTPLPAQAAVAAARVRAVAGQATPLPTQTATASTRTDAVAAAQITVLPVQAAAVRARVSARAAQNLAFPTQEATAASILRRIFVNDDGVWKQATTWVNHDGVWKQPTHIFVNDEGVWKEVA
jgi:hypothetical protein